MIKGQIRETMTGLERIRAFAELGKDIESALREGEMSAVISEAGQKNPWFTALEVDRALSAIIHMLDINMLESWTSTYDIQDKAPLKNVGVVMAGNIPLVGFHDAICVLVSGNRLFVKYSSDDTVLLPKLFSMLIKSEPRFAPMITEVEKLKDIDAVIATGSDNTARYFNYYFRNIPNLIRKNRSSVGVISGEEQDSDMQGLGNDVFNYFGLGCRSVSKLYLPYNYDPGNIFRAFEEFNFLHGNNKYMNNYEYYSAILMLKKVEYLTNGFFIMKESEELAGPVSILNYEFYEDVQQLNKTLNALQEKIQCRVSISTAIEKAIVPGTAQRPGLTDYADEIDTLNFLLNL